MEKLYSFALYIVALLGIGAAPAMALTIVDPDAFADGTDISNAFPGVTISAIGHDVDVSGSVFSVNPSDGSYATDFNASTGTQVFGHDAILSGNALGNVWWRDDAPSPEVILRFDFLLPTDFVSIDVIGTDLPDWGLMKVYDTEGNSLEWVDTALLGLNDIETISFSSSTRNISYILIAGVRSDDVGLDNLKYNPVPEPSTIMLMGVGIVGLVGLRKKFKK